MSFTEQDLKQHLKAEDVKPVYLLYGEESYLTMHYVEQLTKQACSYISSCFCR